MLSAHPDGDVPTVEELTDKLMSLSAREYCKYALDTGIRTEIARLQYAKCVRE